MKHFLFFFVLLFVVSAQAQVKKYPLEADDIKIVEDIAWMEQQKFPDVEPQFCWVVFVSKNSGDTLECWARYLIVNNRGVVLFDLSPVLEDFRQYLRKKNKIREVLILNKNRIPPPVRFPENWIKEYDFYLQVIQ